MPVRLQIAYALIAVMVLAAGWLVLAIRRKQRAEKEKYKRQNAG